MTRRKPPIPIQEPSGGGSEDNGNVHVENKPEWKKRPDQYPDAGEQSEIDTEVQR